MARNVLYGMNPIKNRQSTLLSEQKLRPFLCVVCGMLRGTLCHLESIQCEKWKAPKNRPYLLLHWMHFAYKYALHTDTPHTHCHSFWSLSIHRNTAFVPHNFDKCTVGRLVDFIRSHSLPAWGLVYSVAFDWILEMNIYWINLGWWTATVQTDSSGYRRLCWLLC